MTHPILLALFLGLSLTGCDVAPGFPPATPEQYTAVSKACAAANMEYEYHGFIITCNTRKKHD